MFSRVSTFDMFCLVSLTLFFVFFFRNKELRNAEKLAKPAAMELFTDVYDKLPRHLEEQKEHLKKMIREYPQDYDLKPYAGHTLD